MSNLTASNVSMSQSKQRSKKAKQNNINEKWKRKNLRIIATIRQINTRKSNNYIAFEKLNAGKCWVSAAATMPQPVSNKSSSIRQLGRWGSVTLQHAQLLHYALFTRTVSQLYSQSVIHQWRRKQMANDKTISNMKLLRFNVAACVYARADVALVNCCCFCCCCCRIICNFEIINKFIKHFSSCKSA